MSELEERLRTALADYTQHRIKVDQQLIEEFRAIGQVWSMREVLDVCRRVQCTPYADAILQAYAG